mgnify:CR=1 FL=1
MTTSFPTKPGEELTNGAILLEEIVIDQKTWEDTENIRRDSFVLALLPNAPEPYRTYSRWVTVTPDGEVVADGAAWGHPHRDLGKAMNDLRMRAGENALPSAMGQMVKSPMKALINEDTGRLICYAPKHELDRIVQGLALLEGDDAE